MKSQVKRINASSIISLHYFVLYIVEFNLEFIKQIIILVSILKNNKNYSWRF